MNNLSSLQARLDAMVNEILAGHFGFYDAFVRMNAYEIVALDLLRQLDERGEALAERDARIEALNRALLHALHRAHKDRPACDGCANIRAALKGDQP